MDYKSVTAPCGIDCFNCQLFKDNITDEMKKRMNQMLKIDEEKLVCGGCRKNNCVILPEECKTRACVNEKGVEFCYECGNFPCSYLQPYKDKADTLPHNLKVFNLCRIKNVGVDKWAEEESSQIRKDYFTEEFFIGKGKKDN